jgi:hypothetical protein
MTCRTSKIAYWQRGKRISAIWEVPTRVGKTELIKRQRYAPPVQTHNRSLRKLKALLGRLIRDIADDDYLSN